MALTKRREIFSPDEARRIVEQSPSPLFASLFSFYYLFGCRKMEALALRRKDFNVGERALTVTIPVEKRKTERVPFEHKVQVRLNEQNRFFFETIVRYLGTLPYENSTVWIVSGRHVHRVLVKIVPNAWVHLYRHTRNTRLVDQDATEYQLMVWNGWSDGRPAKRYVQRSLERIKKLGKNVY